MQDIQKAADKLPAGSDERNALQQILDFYGKKDIDNGVTVTFNKKDTGYGDTGTKKGRTTVTLSELGRSQTELAAEAVHEGVHGIDQKAHGMPSNRAQEKAGEVQAYKTQGYVNRGLGVDSVYQIWTSKKGLDMEQVDRLAEQSTQYWCNQGGNCK